MDIMQQIQREIATQFLGVDLKYLVVSLEYAHKIAKEDKHHNDAWYFEYNANKAKDILQKFCTIFPEHAPTLD